MLTPIIYHTGQVQLDGSAAVALNVFTHDLLYNTQWPAAYSYRHYRKLSDIICYRVLLPTLPVTTLTTVMCYRLPDLVDVPELGGSGTQPGDC